MSGGNPALFSGLLGGLLPPVKPRVFVSYHHGNDQKWYNRFSSLFASVYDLITDSSLDRRIDSDNADYVERRIRENHIKGTSVTIIICGTETAKRKYVDWEAYATLYLKHGLLGIVTPPAKQTAECAARLSTLLGRHLNWDNYLQPPQRLKDNLDSGFAHWIEWTTDPHFLRASIERARQLSRFAANIRNGRVKMKRNQP